MDVDHSEEKSTLEEFCHTPRKLVEIVDRFSGMKDLMDDLDEKDAHLRSLEIVCIKSLHNKFHRGWEIFNSRAKTTSVNHTNTKVAPLIQKFHEKADILLNKHAPTFDEYKETFLFGPNFIGYDSSGNEIFEAERFIRTYSSFKDRFKMWVWEKLGNISVNTYQDVFNRLGDDHNIWGEFDEWYSGYFYEPYPTLPESNILDVQEFFRRYCCEGSDAFYASPIGQGGLKKRWDFIRFKKQENIPQSVRDEKILETVQKKVESSKEKGTSFIKINSAYVQKYMQQLAIVEHYRETLATVYKARIPAIVDNIIQHVESGVLEVANEYSNEETIPPAHFIFAARQQRTRIRDYGTNEDIPFGTLDIQHGRLNIIHQRIAAQRRTLLMQKARNDALRINRTKQSFHGIKVPLMLSRLLPYYTPKCTYIGQSKMPNYEYRDNKGLDTLTEQNSGGDDDDIDDDDDSGDDDDIDDIEDILTYDFEDDCDDGCDDGCDGFEDDDEAMSGVGETKQTKRPSSPPDNSGNIKKPRTFY